MKNFCAKSNGTTLKDHSLKTALMANSIMTELGCTNEHVKKIAITAAIFHDIGKTSDKFQKYLKSNNENEISPGHNCVGSVLYSSIMNSNDLNRLPDIKLVKDIIEFHHTPYVEKNTRLSDFYSINDISDIIDYYKNIISEVETVLGINLDVKFINDVDDIDVDVEIKKNISFSYNDNIDNLLSIINNGGVFLAAYDTVRYADVLVSSGNEKYTRQHISSINVECPSHYSKGRWDEQFKHVMDIVNDKTYTTFSINAPTGYGKTLMAILFTLLNGGYSFFILPTNTLAEAMYKSINKHLEELNLNNITVSLLLSGEWRDGEMKEKSNIIVTNIDNFELSVFKNKRKDTSIQRLSRNCIFDEFHKYLTDAPLAYSFVASSNARNYFKNTKTLFLSATPIYDKKFINKDKLKEIVIENKSFNEQKIVFHYINAPMSSVISDMRGQDILCVVPTVKDVQRYSDYFDYTLHAMYTDSDKNDNLNRVLKLKGKNNRTNDSYITTNIISEGVDVSFNSATYVFNQMYEEIIQSSGRNNRFNSTNVKHVYIVLDRDNTFYQKNILGNWNVIENMFQSLQKTFKEGVEYSWKDIITHRNNFVTTDDAFKLYLRKKIENSIENYSKITFSEGQKYKESKEQKSKKSGDGSKMSLRGANGNLYVTTIDENGNFIEPIAVPDHVFQSGFTQKNLNKIDSDVVKDTIKYMSKLGETHNKHIKNIKKKSELDQRDIIINKARCSDTPLFMKNWSYTKQDGLITDN